MKTTSTKSSPAPAEKSRATASAKKGLSAALSSNKSRACKALVASLGVIAVIFLVSYFIPAFGAACAVVAGTKFALLVALPEGQIRSGKSGTVVWQKNGRMRVNAFPALVQNAFTTAIRATLGSFSGAWNSLTQAQQNGWLNAEGWTSQNRIGQTVILKGKTLYVTLNTNLETIGETPIDDVPARESVPSPLFSASPTADVSSTQINMNFDNTDAAYGFSLEATNKLSFGSNSPGRNKYKSFFAVPDSAAALGLTDIWDAYAARFGAPVAGEVFFIRALYISNTNGQASGRSQSWKVVVSA